MLLQLFWKVDTRMGRCRMNFFKICASRIMLSARMFPDLLAIGVWYACFSRKKVLVFSPSLIIGRNSFSICILYLQDLMDIDKKYTHQVHLKYKSVSLNTLVRRKKKKFRYFWFLSLWAFLRENSLLPKTMLFSLKKYTSYCSACSESAIEN